MKYVILCIIFSLALTGKAYAYIDPGSGSAALQMLLLIIFSGLASLRIFWKRIRSFFTTDNSSNDSINKQEVSPRDEE